MSHQDEPQGARDPRTRADDAQTGEGGGPTVEGHPGDELLAAFVDGSISEEDRRRIEDHLAECDACASDVVAARAAHDALRAIPEVDSPWSEGVDPLVAAATSPAPAISIKERRGAGVRWRGTAAAALAAAAVLTGVVVLLAHGGSNTPPHLSAAAPAQSAGAARTVTQQSLFDLTRSLATSPDAKASYGASEGAGASAPVTTSGVRQPAAPNASQSLLASDAVGGIPCARRASAQPVSALAIYAQTATFNGKPVWVIGFVSAVSAGQPAHVEVVAVTTNNCAIAFLARQPLAS